MLKYYATHKNFREAKKKNERIRNRKIKNRVLTHYGKRNKLCCSWKNCVVSDLDMLSIDHIKDNGANHRSRLTKGKYRGGGGLNFYKWLERNNFPSGNQTLCHNHQWKKEILRRKLQIPKRVNG